MNASFVLRTMARRGLLTPGRPDKVIRQLEALRLWGYTLIGEMRQAAARDPGRVALIDETRSLTYGELADEALRLTHGLRTGYGLVAGDRVGIMCRNSTAMIEAMLAVGAIGADVVLVNTGLGPGQLETVLHNQRVMLLIHDDEFFELLSAVPPAIKRLSADGVARRGHATVAGLIAGGPSTEAPPPARTGRTIVLTSGTTGAPKGARRPLPHGFKPLAGIIARIPLSTGERMFIAAPIFHTWGYAALQMALALRATMVLRRRFEPAEVHQVVAHHKCTALLAVPVMLQLMLDTPPPAGYRSPLRVVASSGSGLPAPLVTRFMDTYGDVLYNLYGSTEVSLASIATPAELRRDPTCAGRPAPGTQVVVIDPSGNPLPPGHIGRIFVGSDNVFDGYTDGAAGRDSPDGGRSGHGEPGLIATGDLGHLTRDGLLHVDGREDDMVISGGENVYPSAVEDVIAQLPQVREVAVVGVADATYGQRLAAWIALHPGERLDAEAVREYVRRTMARFSVPREVYFVSELPRNATGKVVHRELRAALRRPDLPTMHLPRIE